MGFAKLAWLKDSNALLMHLPYCVASFAAFQASHSSSLLFLTIIKPPPRYVPEMKDNLISYFFYDQEKYCLLFPNSASTPLSKQNTTRMYVGIPDTKIFSGPCFMECEVEPKDDLRHVEGTFAHACFYTLFLPCSTRKVDLNSTMYFHLNNLLHKNCGKTFQKQYCVNSSASVCGRLKWSSSTVVWIYPILFKKPLISNSYFSTVFVTSGT